MRVFLSSCQKTRQSQCRIGGHLGYISAEYILRTFADVKGPGLVMELGASIMMMDNSIAISFIFLLFAAPVCHRWNILVIICRRESSLDDFGDSSVF